MFLVKSKREGDTVSFESTYIPETQETPSVAGGSGYPGPFEISITDTTATLTDCIVQRQMCYVRCGDDNDEATVTVNGTGTEYIYVEVEDAYTAGGGGHGTVKNTTTKSTAYDVSPPEDQSVYKILLYRLEDGVIACDYRKTPQVGAQA